MKHLGLVLAALAAACSSASAPPAEQPRAQARVAAVRTPEAPPAAPPAHTHGDGHDHGPAAAAGGPETSPTARLAFYRELLAKHGTTLEGVTCECCQKSLGQCYRDTLSDAPIPKCPIG